ncbi:glycosyltransferase [Georgenia halophila]|uniref:D-inositol 3-phosphate glycosyltransferase n=2 Tax=Georgenia halophila TaxID=620889 RepID=A0ABP8LIY6_9MICO
MNVAVRHTAAEMAARGHLVEILTRWTSPQAPAEMELAPGVLLRQLRVGPPEPRDKGDHEQYVAEFADALATLEPYDVVHSHHWFSGIAALEQAHLAGTPHVQSFNSIAAPAGTPLSSGERPESPGRLGGEAHLAATSDAIVVASRAERTTVVDRLGADPARVVQVTPGVDSRQFRPAAHGRGDYILAAARLEPLKGLDLAIETLAALDPAERPRLVVSGGATSGFRDYPGRLLDLAARLGVAEDVELAGPQSRTALADLMAGARLLLVPSHSETFGLVALEAQACATPVVAADSGGLRDAVADGVTGVLVPGWDPDRWAAELRALLSDTARCERLGAAGRERALLHTWGRTAARTLDVYGSLLPAPARCRGA